MVRASSHDTTELKTAMMRLIQQLATRRLKTPFSVARWSVSFLSYNLLSAITITSWLLFSFCLFFVFRWSCAVSVLFLSNNHVSIWKRSPQVGRPSRSTTSIPSMKQALPSPLDRKRPNSMRQSSTILQHLFRRPLLQR